MGKELVPVAELPLEGGKLNVIEISKISAMQLGKLLLGEVDAPMNRSLEIAEQIGRDPVLRGQAESVLESVQRMSRPLGRTEDAAGEVYRAMAPLVICYGRPKKVEAELKVWWGTYYDAFADIPLMALEHAVSEFIAIAGADQPHMIPIPSKLKKLALPKAAELFVAAYRLRKALETPLPKPPPTEEERAEVKAGLEQLLSDMGKRRRALDPTPAPGFMPSEIAARLRVVSS